MIGRGTNPEPGDMDKSKPSDSIDPLAFSFYPFPPVHLSIFVDGWPNLRSPLTPDVRLFPLLARLLTVQPKP